MAKLDKQSMAPCFLRKHSDAGIANKGVSVSDLSLREKPQKDVQILSFWGRGQITVDREQTQIRFCQRFGRI